jgi:endonuclease/exonuclease/phosphatase family metal-dependent hydrolase
VSEPQWSRRRLLRSAVGAAGSASVAGTATGSAAANRRDDGWEASVATWNLGLGADFLSVARGGDAPVAERVGVLYRQVLDSRPRVRMDAVAAALAEHRPDVVGLQEAAVVRRAPRSGGAPAEPDAETVAVDHLAALRGALEDRGVPYRVAAVATNADLEFPGRVDGEAVDVRVTDRDVLLLRADADAAVAEARTGTYDASLTLPVGDGRTVAIPRGYAAAELDVRGERITAVTTHLEAALEGVRRAQADELASVVASLSPPAVLLGDLNDGPGPEAAGAAANGTTTSGDDPATGAYGLVTAELDDPVDPGEWPGAPTSGPGTCCRPASLRPPDADGLSRRIDHVLVAGLRASGSRRLGVDPASVDGSDRAVWPSDHAGVLVGLTPPGASTTTDTGAAATTTPEPTATTTATETPIATPGFGVPAGLAAVCAAAAAAALRRNGPDEP